MSEEDQDATDLPYDPTRPAEGPSSRFTFAITTELVQAVAVTLWPSMPKLSWEEVQVFALGLLTDVRDGLEHVEVRKRRKP